MSNRNTTLTVALVAALSLGFVQSAEAVYPDNASRNDAITSAASKRNFTLVGTGDGSPECTSERPSVSLDECEAVAASLDGEVMHRGSWEWAPKGCHWNTKHGSVWFNEHLEGSHSNTNYTSICAMDSSGDDVSETPVAITCGAGTKLEGSQCVAEPVATPEPTIKYVNETKVNNSLQAIYDRETNTCVVHPSACGKNTFLDPKTNRCLPGQYGKELPVMQSCQPGDSANLFDNYVSPYQEICTKLN